MRSHFGTNARSGDRTRRIRTGARSREGDVTDQTQPDRPPSHRHRFTGRLPLTAPVRASFARPPTERSGR